MHTPGHQHDFSFESQRNKLADQMAKKAAVLDMPIFHLIPHLPSPTVVPIFSLAEKEKLVEIPKEKKKKNSEESWILPNQREMLSKPFRREVLSYLHQGTHWVPRPYVTQFSESLGVLAFIL